MAIPPPAVRVLCLLTALATLPAQQPQRLSERGPGLVVAEPDANERELRMTPIVRAVQRAADSVVSVYVQNQHSLADRTPVTQGQGSGVLLDESGLVITNWHVIWPIVALNRQGLEFRAEVKLRDGRTRPAAVISHSQKHDLALLQIQLEGDEKVQPARIGRSSDLMIGETLIAIGNPQGHSNTVTTGVLSAIDRSIMVRAPDGQTREYSQLIQTDAAINQGNSGGALLDITGKLVGINNAMAVGAENIGFAIPMDLVREVFESELSRSDSFAVSLEAPWLGLDVVERGDQVVISSVLVDSPAGRAGVEAGDVLTAVRGQPVRGSLDYQRLLVSAPVGAELELRIRRGHRELTFDTPATTRTDWRLYHALGCEFEDVTYSDEQQTLVRVTGAFNDRKYRGRVRMLPGTLRVKAVAENSPAAGLLEPGDLVFAAVVRDTFSTIEMPLTSRRELYDQVRLSEGKTIKLAFLRGANGYYATVDVRRVQVR